MRRIIQKPRILAERSFPRLVLATLVAGALLLGVTPAQASTPEQACQNGRYAAAAQYGACQQKALAKYFKGSLFDPKFQAALSKCRLKYTGTWAKLQAKASGSGATCDVARFVVSGGTVTDNLTGLQWEQKTDDASIHDKDDLYTWSAIPPFMAADGAPFTTFLPALNGGGCFAGQCDWRLPTISELQTIVLEAFPCTTNPCIDPIFGPTVAGPCWSSTGFVAIPGNTWSVGFNNGKVDFFGNISNLLSVRAVRAGL